MNASKRKKNVDIVVYLLICTISILSIFFANPIILFTEVSVILLILIFRAKFSFFSILSFLLWYSYLQEILRIYIGVTQNTLAWAGQKMPIYFKELTVSTVSFFLIALFFVNFTTIIDREKKLYALNISPSLDISLILIVISIILIILVFPSFPTFRVASESVRRTQGFSSLYGLVLLSLLLSGITVDQGLHHNWLLLGYLFLVFWSFGHGERIEVMGFLIYYALKYFNQPIDIKNKKRVLRRRVLMISIVSGFVLIFGIWLGLVREGRVSSVNFSEILFNLLQQGTAGDVVYVFNCATDLWKNGNALHGLTYIDYLLRLIPGGADTFSAAVVIQDFYLTMGGGLFYAEPMMNFGIIGVIIMNLEFFLVMKLILFKVTKFRAYFWIPIVIEIFRTAWYGRGAWLLACFVEIPIIYFMMKLIKNNSKI